MKKSVIKTLAMASLVSLGATACTSNPFASKSVDTKPAPKAAQGSCGGNKNAQASCGGKKADASCGGKNAEAKCGSK